MADANAQAQFDHLAQNVRDFGFEMFDGYHAHQGIEHLVLPDLCWVLPRHSTGWPTWGKRGDVRWGRRPYTP